MSKIDFRLYRVINDDFSWDSFRSELSHYLKNKAKVDFLKDVTNHKVIDLLWDKAEYGKALYVLALYDYYTIKEGQELNPDFSEYRKNRLANTMYPSGVLMLDAACGNNVEKEKMLDLCRKNELSRAFLKYNIAEIMEE